MRKPLYYTCEEGGEWIPWPKDKKCYKRFLSMREHDVIDIEDLTVHSLAFDEYRKGPGKFPRWDCLNGWTDR